MEIANVMLNFLVQYYLWTAVLSSNRLFFEDKNRMIVYYFYISLLSVLMRCNASDIADAFKNGKMDRELIRPVNVFALKMYENIFSNLFLFLCSFPLLSVLTFLGFGMKMQVNMNGLLLFLLAVFVLCLPADPSCRSRGAGAAEWAGDRSCRGVPPH